MRVILITWAAAWPTITVLLQLLGHVMEDWPLPLRTLVLTAVMVPVVRFWGVPGVTWVIDRAETGWMWVHNRHAGRIEQASARTLRKCKNFGHGTQMKG